MRRLAIAVIAFLALTAPRLATAVVNAGDPAAPAPMSWSAVEVVVVVSGVILVAGLIVAWRAERVNRRLGRWTD